MEVVYFSQDKASLDDVDHWCMSLLALVVVLNIMVGVGR